MPDESFREFIANVVKHGPKEAAALRVRAPNMQQGRPKRGQPGWRDPDQPASRGSTPPSGGVRGERF